MLLHIPRVLTESQIARGRPLLEQAKWVDGRETSGHLAARVKHNRQVDEGTPEAREMGNIIVSALERTTRAQRGTMGVAMARMTLPAPVPSIATTARARMITGKAKNTSITRCTIRS